MAVDLLANFIVIMATFAFEKQYFHALGHINAKELIRVAHNGSESGQKCGFQDGVLGEICFSECLRAQIPLDNKGAIETSEDTNEHVEGQLEEVPLSIVGNCEHD